MRINQAISLRSIVVLSNLASTSPLSNSTASFRLINVREVDHSYIPLVTSPQVKQLFFNGVYTVNADKIIEER